MLDILLFPSNTRTADRRQSYVLSHDLLWWEPWTLLYHQKVIGYKYSEHTKQRQVQIWKNDFDSLVFMTCHKIYCSSFCRFWFPKKWKLLRRSKSYLLFAILSQSVYVLKNLLFVESLTLWRYLTSAQKYFRKRQTADMNGNLNVLARTQKELSCSVFSTL